MTFILNSKAWTSIENPTERLERGLDYVIDNVAKDVGYTKDRERLMKIMLWEFAEMQRFLFTISECEDIYDEPSSVKKKTKKDWTQH